MRHDELEGLAQALFEESGDALLLFDPDTDQLLDANSTAQRMTGFPLRDLLRMPVSGLFHFSNDQGLDEIRQASRKSGVFHSQEGYLLRTVQDGVWVPVHLTVARLHVKPSPLGLITARDIRKHYEAHAHLQKMEAEHRRVMASISDCLWSATIDDAGRCVYHYFSPVVEKLTGQPPDYFFVGIHRWWSIVHPEDQPRWEKALVRLRSGQSHQEEYRILWPDGTHRWVRESVQVSRAADRITLRLDGVITDITQRKDAAEALRQAEEQYRQIVEASSEGIWILDAEARTTFVNSSLTRMLEYQAEEMLGRPLLDFMNDDRRAQTMVALDQHRSGLKQPYEMQFRRKSGDELWALVSLADFRGQRGEHAGLLGMITDITERRHLQADLRLSQKRAAIDKLASGAIHDFSNLLTVTLAYRQILVDRLGATDRLRLGIDEIVQTLERVASVIRWLLSFGREQALCPAPWNLNVIIADLEQALRRLIGEDIHLTTALASHLGLVRADRGQIEHALLNLVLSSRAAMPQGGRLTVATADTDLDANSAKIAGDLPPGPYVTLAIIDSGATVPAQSGCDENWDLSLRTAEEIVKENGGTLRARRDAGGGGTFSIYLPRLTEPAEDTVVGLTPDSETLLGLPNDRSAGVKGGISTIHGSETILLVEDEEAVRAVVRDVLEAAGYAVLEAGHGQEALQVAEKHAAPIHLLVTDVVMPQLGGPELAERLMVRYPNLKVLFVTGYATKPAINHPVLEQEAELLQKPFTTNELAFKVRELLDREAAHAPSNP